MERARFELGDTDPSRAPVHGGSIALARVVNAVHEACRTVLARFGQREGGDFAGELRWRGLEYTGAGADAAPGDEQKRWSSAAFGAVLVELHVDPDLGTVRLPRLVGAPDVGRVVKPKTARSQCIGGLVEGIGMALLEEAEWDPRYGRVMNANSPNSWCR